MNPSLHTSTTRWLCGRVQTAHGLLRITLASWRHDYSKVTLLLDKGFNGADLAFDRPRGREAARFHRR